MRLKIFPLAIIIMLGISSCGVTFNIPQETLGPLAQEQIQIAVPSAESGSTRVAISFGAGELYINPGSEFLLSGQVKYNIPDFKPEITLNGNYVDVKQGSYNLNKIPNFNNMINTWDLVMGDTPIDLDISAGAYTALFNFGGLSLTNLSIKDGASDVKLSFTQKNNSQMNLFRYETGASLVNISGLSNANFSLLEFTGGAGNYTLDFSGDLSRDATASITTGLGNLRIIIPEGLPTQLTVDGNLTNISIDSHWTKTGDTYSQAGSGPLLTIIIKIGAANLVVSGR